MYENSEVDIILMDIQMPKMDGLEATRIIRDKEKSKNNHVPIIALTANTMKSDEKKCFEWGMDEYTTKPVDIKKLYQILEKYKRL